jgi:hypothetical protein
MQPLSLNAVPNRPAAQPELDQLGMRHGSVLRVGKLREEGVRRTRSHFDSYVMSKRLLAVHESIIAGRKQPGTAPA